MRMDDEKQDEKANAMCARANNKWRTCGNGDDDSNVGVDICAGSRVHAASVTLPWLQNLGTVPVCLLLRRHRSGGCVVFAVGRVLDGSGWLRGLRTILYHTSTEPSNGWEAIPKSGA